MRRAVLCLAIALYGCAAARRFETAGYDQACARECEHNWEQCKAACPQEPGAALGCRMNACNPARSQCLGSCPPVSGVPE